MHGLRLLERLAFMEEKPEERGVFDKEMVINSIIRNLSNILNTRIGSAQTAPDLGTPDFTDLLGRPKGESFEELKKIIKGVIERYEPRLSNVKIQEEVNGDDPFSLSFRIECEVNTDEGKMDIHFCLMCVQREE